MQDWMIVAIIGIVVIFGASKLPQLAKNVGKAQTEFKKGLKEGASEDAPAPAQPAVAPEPASPAADAPASPPAADQPPAEQPTPIENPPTG